MGMSIRLFIAGLLSLFALALSQSVPTVDTAQHTATAPIPNTQTHTEVSMRTVARIIDGDTIELDDGSTVRYIGIDTPEVYPKRNCYGSEAAAYNTELILGKNVRLVSDVSNTDKYSRLLRYVYLEDGTFVNEKLVREGYAHARSYPPDIAQQQTLRDAEREAQTERRGLWRACEN